MPLRLRKKRVEVEAVQWLGYNFDEVKEFLGNDYLGETSDGRLRIRGWHMIFYAEHGDYVIRMGGSVRPYSQEEVREMYEVVG